MRRISVNPLPGYSHFAEYDDKPEDADLGDQLSFVIGDTYIDCQTMSPFAQWTRIAKALRLHGIDLVGWTDGQQNRTSAQPYVPILHADSCLIIVEQDDSQGYRPTTDLACTCGADPSRPPKAYSARPTNCNGCGHWFNSHDSLGCQSCNVKGETCPTDARSEQVRNRDNV